MKSMVRKQGTRFIQPPKYSFSHLGLLYLTLASRSSLSAFHGCSVELIEKQTVYAFKGNILTSKSSTSVIGHCWCCCTHDTTARPGPNWRFQSTLSGGPQTHLDKYGTKSQTSSSTHMGLYHIRNCSMAAALMILPSLTIHHVSVVKGRAPHSIEKEEWRCPHRLACCIVVSLPFFDLFQRFRAYSLE